MRSLMPCLAMLALMTAPASPAPAEDMATVAGKPIQTGLTHELTSRVMGDVRQINIWLPPGHEKAKEGYTVLYLIDGALDQDFHHIAGLAQLASLSWTFGPMMVVGVQTRERQAELTPRPTDPRYLSAFPKSGDSDRFRRFLKEEVIPFVEARYPAGKRRAVMGESLGGLFVVDTLLKEPSLFNDYVAISPSLWWDDRRPMKAAAAQLAGNGPSDRRLYIAIGDEGGTMQDGVNMLRAALEQSGRGITLRYSDRSATATHSTIYHGAAEEALRWLYPAPPYDAGATPWFMIEGASPPPPG